MAKVQYKGFVAYSLCATSTHFLSGLAMILFSRERRIAACCIRAVLLLLFGAAMSPGTAATPEQIKEVAKELVCLCGNCNRESLATCMCTEFAVPEREKIGAALDAGKTKEQIIDEYLAQFGEVMLPAPPPEGYKLIAWIAPFASLVLGVVLVRSVLLRWQRKKRDPSSQGATAQPASPQDREYQQRLRQELDSRDD